MADQTPFFGTLRFDLTERGTQMGHTPDRGIIHPESTNKATSVKTLLKTALCHREVVSAAEGRDIQFQAK